MHNNVLNLIASRHCKRAFLNQSVPRGLLETVLRCAANGPSSQNNQPWQVAVLSGKSRDELSAKLIHNFDADVLPKADYLNRPSQIDDLLAARIEEYGASFLEFKGIERDDREARRLHRRENFLFFGAPTELIFHLPANAAPGTFLDLGFFMQNVMLGLIACGLGSCPQYSVASYAATVRDHLRLGDDRMIIAGMAVGYVDVVAPINQFVPCRADLEEYVAWFD
jgi:nitroreductase